MSVIVEYYGDSKEYYIAFRGENFDELLFLAKTLGFKYDKENRVWSTSKVKALSAFIEGVRGIPEESLRLTPEAKDFMTQQLHDIHETNFVRGVLDKSLFKVPPYKGKPPYENYQTDYVKRVISQNRLALYLGQGTGKSYIMITALNHYFKQGKIDHVLIVSPVEAIYNWKNELQTFATFPVEDDDFYIATAKNRNPFGSGAHIVIMSYNTFRLVSDDAYKRIHRKTAKKYRKPCIDFDSWGSPDKRVVILDESHEIKGHSSRKTHVQLLHKGQFHYRYLLTGTPAPNRFDELYTQIKFLDEGYVPDSYYSFLNEIASVGNRFSQYAINAFYPDKIAKYEQKFKDLVIRVKSEELLDLPELYIKDIHLPLQGLQLDIYRELVTQTLNVVKESNSGRLVPREVYNKFPYISLALDNPEILRETFSASIGRLPELVKKFDFKKHHGKLETTTALIDRYVNEEKRKVIIFDFHPRSIDTLAEYYDKYKPFKLHGDLKGVQDIAKYRAEMFAEFKSSKTRNLFIASSRVLNTAVNLQESTRAIYFARDYSYLFWSQSQKRIHRIGTTEPVIINPLIFEDSLDVRLANSIQAKQDLDDTIFNSEYLALDDWKDIFAGRK